MKTGKPVLQVRPTAEYEIICLVCILHANIMALTAVFAMGAPVLCSMFPLVIFSFVRTWQNFVVYSRPASIRLIRIDSLDKVSVLMQAGQPRAARLHAFRVSESGILMCLDVKGVFLVRTVFIGSRSASSGQRRRLKIRIRQLLQEQHGSGN